MAPTALINGYQDHEMVNGNKSKRAPEKLTSVEELVLKAFRVLIADLCQQFKGGHPGYSTFQIIVFFEDTYF